MHITKLNINKFRGINQLEIDDIKKINLLVGKNNCSKTSILESIFLLLGASNPEIILRINNYREILLTEENDLRFVFYNLDYLSEPIITGEFNEKDYVRELIVKPNTNVNGRQQKVQKYSKGAIVDLKSDTAIIEDSINELLLKFNIKEQHNSKKFYESKITFDNGTFNIKQDNKYKETIRCIFVIPKIGLALNMEKKLENLIITKQHQKIIEILKKIDPAIQNISFGTNRMLFVDVGINRLIPLNIIGDGVRKLLSILLAVSDAPNGIVLIDEIDNGLHFSALKILWKAIIELAFENNVQIFITTHNLEALKSLNDILQSEDLIKVQSDIRCYTLRKLETNEIKSYKYDFSNFEFAINQNIELR